MNVRNRSVLEEFWKESVARRSKKNLPQVMFYVFLIFLSLIYGFLSFISRSLRARKKIKVNATVVSVGNIAVGGTGKTQVIEMFAQILQQRHIKFSILCHGYKSKKKAAQPFVNPDDSIDEAGDEAFYLANKFRGAPVLVGRNRIQNARLALKTYDASVLLLDDAFQYTRLHRDADIVLIDAANPAGNGRLFPAGILREPFSSLSRATVVLLSKANLVSPQERETIIRRFIRPYTSAPVFEMHVHADKLKNLCTQEECSVDALLHKHILIFCGIGSPESFVQTVKQCSPSSVESYFFPDHHDYTRDDVRRIFDRAVREGREMMVTTEKDAVKLSIKENPVVPVFSLNARVVFHPDIEEHKELFSFLYTDEKTF